MQQTEKINNFNILTPNLWVFCCANYWRSQTYTCLVINWDIKIFFSGVEEKGQKEKFTFEDFFGHDYKINRFYPKWRKGKLTYNCMDLPWGYTLKSGSKFDMIFTVFLPTLNCWKKAWIYSCQVNEENNVYL